MTDSALARSSVGGASVASQSSGAGSALDVGLLKTRPPSPSANGSDAGGTREATAEPAAGTAPREPLKARLWRWFQLYFLKPVFGCA